MRHQERASRLTLSSNNVKPNVRTISIDFVQSIDNHKSLIFGHCSKSSIESKSLLAHRLKLNIDRNYCSNIIRNGTSRRHLVQVTLFSNVSSKKIVSQVKQQEQRLELGRAGRRSMWFATIWAHGRRHDSHENSDAVSQRQAVATSKCCAQFKLLFKKLVIIIIIIIIVMKSSHKCLPTPSMFSICSEIDGAKNSLFSSSVAAFIWNTYFPGRIFFKIRWKLWSRK